MNIEQARERRRKIGGIASAGHRSPISRREVPDGKVNVTDPDSKTVESA